MNKDTQVFEAFILKPLWVSYFVAMIFLFIQQKWIVSGFFLLVLFYLGWVGGAIINRGKTFKELSKGTLPKTWASNEDESTPGKACSLGEAVTYIFYVVTITAIIIAFQYGFKFYISIPIGLVVGFILREIFIFVTVFLAEKLK